jgi:hypothetical protein
MVRGACGLESLPFVAWAVTFFCRFGVQATRYPRELKARFFVKA